MTSGDAPAYAPFTVVADDARFGLVKSSVSNELGTAVIHSKKTSRSRRATIFLHGAAGSWSTWTPLLETAEAAALTIVNPVLLDLPGWGEGSLTASGERSAIDAVSSLVRESAESLGFTEWDIIGHSMGGFIAMHMASIWPECVASVATVSATSWSVIDAVAHPILHFWRLPGFLLLWRGMQAMAVFGRPGARLARGLGAVGLLRPTVAPLFRHPYRVPSAVISALGREVRPRAFATAVKVLRGYDAAVAWARIECPVRAVQGDRDLFATSSDLERLAETLPGSHGEIIPDCGHFALIERPRTVLAALGYEPKPPKR